MKLFQLAYSDYESFCPHLFLHADTSKGEDEFKADVNSLLTKYGQEYIEASDGWVGVDDWMGYILPKMEELGYQSIKPEVCYNLWGSCILDDEHDIKEAEWEEKVGRELCDAAIKKNATVRSESDKLII